MNCDHRRGEPMNLHVRLTPKSASNHVGGTRLDAQGQEWLLVHVTVPPEDNKANRAMIKLLAKHFSKPMHCFTLIKGHMSRNKTVKISSH